jgi:hypothetical protein
MGTKVRQALIHLGVLGPITAFQLNYALFVGIGQVGGISLSRFGELKDEAFPASRPRGFLLADFPDQIPR